MQQTPLLQNPAFKAFAGEIINGKNLGIGGALIWLITLIVSAAGAIVCLRFFPEGSYPRIVLALPGLLLGGVAFFIGTTILFHVRKPTSKE